MTEKEMRPIEKYIGFFGHETIIQNFFQLYLPEDKLSTNKHQIPEFAATISWKLFSTLDENGNVDYELEIQINDDYLDIIGCPNGICNVQ